MLGHLVIILLLCAEGYIGKNLGIHRYKRDEDVGGIIYAPCKDTYSQCAEWKKSGWCEMEKYKDYMPLVCTDTCGFCKPKDDVTSDVTQQEASKVEVNPDTTPKDKIQQDYETELKKYYENLQETQKAYQQSIKPELAPVATEAATTNSEMSSPATTDTGTAISNASPLDPATGMVAAYLPYNPYPGYPAYAAATPPAEEGASPSSVSSPSASSSTDALPEGVLPAGFAPQNGTERNSSTEGSPKELSSKVDFDTPSLPALPPLVSIPLISESLLLDEPAKSNSSSEETASTEKEKVSEQEADSKLLEKEPNIPTKEDSKEESKKKTGNKHLVKADSAGKIATEEKLQTNEMEKLESKHLSASARHNLDENDDDDGEEGSASDNDSGKSKGNAKRKTMASDSKLASQQKALEKESEHESEADDDNDDAVYKHDEKSVADGGSGAAAVDMKESVGDLNYFTDFNSDDFDMDVADISRKDLLRLHGDRRNLVQFPENHPLYLLSE